MEKYILDVCCGSRAWWKQKKNPNTIYMDIRKEEKGFIGWFKKIFRRSFSARRKN